MSRILLCTGFSMLFEYCFRGPMGFIRIPVLLPLLFLLYVSYYAVLEDLIARWRLHNYEFFLLGVPLGLLIDVFGTGTIFDKHLPLGINAEAYLFGSILWGFILQGLFAFYAANRLCPRQWSRSPLGWKGWTATLGYLLLAFFVMSHNRLLVHDATGGGYITIGSMACIALLALALSLRRPRPAPWPVRRSRLLDTLVAISVVLFIVLGTSAGPSRTVVAASYGNVRAVRIFVLWTFVYVGGYLLYRVRSGQEVSI